jgi:hypothetical protein
MQRQEKGWFQFYLDGYKEQSMFQKFLQLKRLQMQQQGTVNPYTTKTNPFFQEYEAQMYGEGMKP